MTTIILKLNVVATRQLVAQPDGGVAIRGPSQEQRRHAGDDIAELMLADDDASNPAGAAATITGAGTCRPRVPGVSPLPNPDAG